MSKLTASLDNLNEEYIMSFPADTQQGGAEPLIHNRQSPSLQSEQIHPHTRGAHAGHGHAHDLTREKLRLGFLLTLGILAVEIVGGAAAHSLALLSDAGHVFTDAAALGVAWFAAAQAARPADARRTYGYHRVGILTALGNGLTLVLVALAITYEAYQRFRHPEPVRPAIMIASALVAVIINLYIGIGLHREGGHSLNVRAAMLHVFGDVGASLGVVFGAVAIVLTGAYWVDPLVSVLIAALITFGAVRLIGEAGHILLESTPKDVSLPRLAEDMRRVQGIYSIHDLHVWAITNGMHALSCHAIIDDLPPSDSAYILDRLSAMLRRDYHITHTTIQFESQAHASHDGFCACPPGSSETIYCEQRPGDGRAHSHPHGHAHSHA
jgi:cobalt-zinc-cadmium efflux system protein